MVDLQHQLAGLISSTISYLPFLLLFGVWICLHEFGHWSTAQWAQLCTPRFKIGFGSPSLCLGTFRRTEFHISPWLFMGYVQIEGLLDLTSKISLWKRLIVISAGIIMNLLLAVIITTTLFMVVGIPDYAPRASRILDNSPAQSAGLLRGDEITAINGVPQSYARNIAEIVKQHPGQTLAFTIKRDGSNITKQVTPNENGIIGFVFESAYIPVSAPVALYDAITVIYSLLAIMTQFLAMIIGILPPVQGASVENLTGPIGILQASYASWKSGWFQFAMLMAQLNVGIAFFNMLPVPGLDGWHFVKAVVQRICSVQMNERMEKVLDRIGISVIGTLMVVAFWNDISRLLRTR